MRVRHATAVTTALALLMSMPVAAAFAAEGSTSGAAEGSTSGPAAGNHVTPSTAVQKNGEDGSKAATGQGGGPGVEGQPGNKNGPAATSPSSSGSSSGEYK
ncbi:MAG: hypothetical protein EPN75_11555 [Beijerinckiaceae bacterium]|nr:MAG: hypothetical protein EPN75_11555 [Beijerinckiaceae bacterium]